LRIGFTSDYFHPQNVGGAERSALELAKALVSKGHEVVVYTRHVKGLPEEEEMGGIRIKRIFRHLARYTVRNDVVDQRKVDGREKETLVRAAEEDSVDILHSQNRDTATFTAMAGKELGIPAIAHIRDYWPVCPKRDLLGPEGICSRPENCASCMARFYGSALKKPFYARMEKDTLYRREVLKKARPFYLHISDFSRNLLKLEPSRRIYNPVDTSAFRRGNEVPGKVLYIGSLARHKGVGILAEAVAKAGLELHIIGDGPMRKGLETRAVLHGRLEYRKMAEELGSAEMLVVPSLWNEPFGRVVIEGMAAGKPVIVSRRGALPEVGGDAVISVEPAVEALSSAISKLHSEPDMRREIGSLGIARAGEFRPERIAEEVMGLYREIRD